MPKLKVARKAQSPYVKYNKAPYPYTFKRCSHKTEVVQVAPEWKGSVCSICNIIMRNFSK